LYTSSGVDDGRRKRRTEREETDRTDGVTARHHVGLGHPAEPVREQLLAAGGRPDALRAPGVLRGHGGERGGHAGAAQDGRLVLPAVPADHLGLRRELVPAQDAGRRRAAAQPRRGHHLVDLRLPEGACGQRTPRAYFSRSEPTNRWMDAPCCRSGTTARSRSQDT
jgi:hypothetical protein